MSKETEQSENWQKVANDLFGKAFNSLSDQQRLTVKVMSIHPMPSTHIQPIVEVAKARYPLKSELVEMPKCYTDDDLAEAEQKAFIAGCDYAQSHLSVRETIELNLNDFSVNMNDVERAFGAGILASGISMENYLAKLDLIEMFENFKKMFMDDKGFDPVATNATVRETPEGEWREVSKELPEIGQEVWLFTTMSDYVTVYCGLGGADYMGTGRYCHDRKKWYAKSFNGHECGEWVSHWTFLPQPPITKS